MDGSVESTWKWSVLPWGEKTLRFRLIRSELKVFFPTEELGVGKPGWENLFRCAALIGAKYTANLDGHLTYRNFQIFSSTTANSCMDGLVESTWKWSVLPWGEKTLRFRLIRSELKVFFPTEELGVGKHGWENPFRCAALIGGKYTANLGGHLTRSSFQTHSSSLLTSVYSMKN